MSSDLLLCDRMSDVTLKVTHGGYSWRFPAHSLLLQSKSKEFLNMIEERQQEERPLTITLIGVHPDTVLAILKYIYTEEYPIEVTADLLLAAERYGLKHLRERMENELLPNLTVAQACHLLESLENQPLVRADCAVKRACVSVVERHAYTVFATDLVLGLSRQVLVKLLESELLNVPDESIVFWGVWRWGRKQCCKNNRKLEDEIVAHYVDDLLVLIRLSSLRQKKGIPDVAQNRFKRCLPRRCRYEAPEDTLEQSSTWRTCDTWLDLVDAITGEHGNLCLQVSFDRNVMLVGLTLEICAPDQVETVVQLFRESDASELLRQKINCFRYDPRRKLSRIGQFEPWLEACVLFSEPLILSRGEIYSVYIRTCTSFTGLPRSLLSPRRRRVDSTAVTRHGEGVVSVRELYFVPDIKTTWSPQVVNV